VNAHTESESERTRTPDQSFEYLAPAATWVRRDVKENTLACTVYSRVSRRLMVGGWAPASLVAYKVAACSHYYNYRGKKPLMHRKVALPSRFEWIALNEGGRESERSLLTSGHHISSQLKHPNDFLTLAALEMRPARSVQYSATTAAP
jgi:hypothetical protein